MDDYPPGAPTMAMLPKVNPLPSPKRQTSVTDRDRQTGGGQRCLDVCWHVVGAFGVVRVQRIVFRHKAIQPALEITLGGPIGILLDGEARGRVLDENGTKAFVNTRVAHHRLHLGSKFVQTLTRYLDRKLFNHVTQQYSL